MLTLKILKTGYSLLFFLYLIFLVLLGFFLESENISNILFFGFEISANTSTFFSNLSTLLRSGIAFSAGLVAVFNPCGFALLSVYFSYFIGRKDNKNLDSSLRKVSESILISTTVTIGFILIFFLFGLMISSGFYALKNIFSYLGLVISVILLGYGFYMLSGGTIYFSGLNRLANSVGSNTEKNLRFYFYYGISFGLTSLSCSLPVFMSIVFSFSNTSSIGNLFLDFTLFSIGSWISLIIVSISLLFLKVIIEKIKIFFKIYNYVASVILIISGSYLILYWMSEF
ncbi:MAG: hypothetical protein CL773_02115 [Chloroflexi bacterium]|nr:hypothetical protein [Chloroflexota bacterium]